MNKNDTDDFLKKVRECYKKVESNDYSDLKGLSKEDIANVPNFIQGLADHLMQNTHLYVSTNCQEVDGLAECTLIGIARFVCTFLKRLQDGGMMRDGVDAFALFRDGILPAANDLVKQERNETKRMIKILGNKDLTLEECYDMIFNDKVSEEIRIKRLQGLAEIRQMME